MVSYDQSLKEFAKLAYDQKKEKVLAMLKILKEDGNIFQDLWDLIHINETTSEGVFDMIYQVITKAMYSIKEQELENAVENLEKIKGKISKMHQKEMEEQEEADEILSKI